MLDENVPAQQSQTDQVSASYHYLVTDHLGSPVLALNKARETTWKANYEAFGKARVNPASTAQIDLRLPGQYFDAETGLHQNWNRDYAPGIGRYVQADPIGLAGGLNRYVYVNGNPLSKIDSEVLQAIAVPMPGPAIPPAGSLIGACIANPACAAGLAELAGYGIGTAIYPYIELPLATMIDWCSSALSGSGKWYCSAFCNIQVINPSLDGAVPIRVSGSARGKTESEACAEAKRAATQSAPLGTYARHCKCSCSKSQE